jgi:hypothetical protein
MHPKKVMKRPQILYREIELQGLNDTPKEG